MFLKNNMATIDIKSLTIDKIRAGFKAKIGRAHV